MPIYRVIQGTENWHSMRRGISASSAYNLWRLKGPASYRSWYESLQWHGRRPPGTPRRELTGPAIDWGKSFESHACWVYEQVMHLPTRDLGQLYALHDKYDFIGASPDAMVGDWGAVEFKCPYSRVVPEEADPMYWVQCQVQMACMPHVNAVHLAYWKPDLMRHESDVPNAFNMADTMRVFHVSRCGEFQSEFERLAASTWARARSGREPEEWGSRSLKLAKARVANWIKFSTQRLGDFRRATGGASRPGDTSCHVLD